jgi:hypothetical protein
MGLTSSEPDDEPGPGDGNTDDDIRDEEPGTADTAFLLRAERRGTGDGRRYTVTYWSVDASGNGAAGTVDAWVPHDMGHGEEPLLLRARTQPGGTLLEWSPVPDVTGYDVVRGRMQDVAESGDAYELGPMHCVATTGDAHTAGQEDAEVPAQGEIFFYLVGYQTEIGMSYGTPTAAKERRAPSPEVCP